MADPYNYKNQGYTNAVQRNGSNFYDYYNGGPTRNNVPIPPSHLSPFSPQGGQGGWADRNGYNIDTGDYPVTSGVKNVRGSDMSAYRDTYYATPDGGLRAGKMPDDDSKNAGDNSGSPSQGISRLFSKYADKCSMNGVPYIKQSKDYRVKFIWSLLLILAIAAMGYHLYRLISTYYDYKKQTRLQLSFSSLLFPAITLCNVNPMRMSMRYLGSQDLNDYIDSVDPQRLEEILNGWETEYEEVNDDDFFNSDRFSDISSLRSKRSTSSTSQVRNNNFFDSLSFNMSSSVAERENALESYYDESESETWESEAEKSAFYEIEETFQEIYVYEPRSVRARMGHQINDMLLSCSFAGRRCYAKNFTRSMNDQYGVCYTLEYSKFLSRKSGPSDGLELKLYLQTDEYVPGIVTSKGLQLVIHDQGTIAFPSQEGMSVQAGTETSIGLRQLQITRLGKPHGDCTDTETFKERYKITYTRTACLKICAQTRIRTRCGCFDAYEQEVNRVLKNAANLTVCRSAAEVVCAAKISRQFEEEDTTCGCYNPCSETSFDRSTSARQWPTESFAKLLKATVCKQNNGSCNALEQMSDSDIRDEFVKLNIYYEDLNYEELEEEEDYEIDQFLSDIGGTVGLWIGLSILSVFELFHLVIDIVVYICGGRWQKKKRQEQYQTGRQ